MKQPPPGKCPCERENDLFLLNIALEFGDAGDACEKLGIIARDFGMSEIANKNGKSREALYKTLSASGNPTLDTLLKVLRAMNLRLSVTHRDDPFSQ